MTDYREMEFSKEGDIGMIHSMTNKLEQALRWIHEAQGCNDCGNENYMILEDVTNTINLIIEQQHADLIREHQQTDSEVVKSRDC